MLSVTSVVACTDPRVTPEEFLGMGEANSTFPFFPVAAMVVLFSSCEP